MKRLVAVATMVLALPLVGLAPQTGGADSASQPTEHSGRGMHEDAAIELDLASLARRLRETSAIGFFTKLSLRSEVNDLLDRFRAYHSSESGEALEDLRARYTLLLFEILSLLQDADPELSRDLSASREAIWAVLSDPQRFRSL